ncbi:Detected protein of confused Function [Hibiscus syriacus]|uniref:Detected protein of confused Function n=1 Tax=Hibiscus syriacus TaxID=106335 RepID=A0A6A3AF35_HIBSY|nr:Detected protein of confused Function [Hibiscus syriacus]
MFLLTLSFVMALGCLVSIFSQVPNFNILVCFPRGTSPSGPLFFWAYIFYLSKIVEFMDTLLIILSGSMKRLSFLHVYHHSMVVIMCYICLDSVQSSFSVVLVTNCVVHVVMYTYYLMCTLGMRPRWKKTVTDFQLMQFWASFLIMAMLIFYHFTAAGCSGILSWCFNAVFILSLLYLFSDFHAKNYPNNAKVFKVKENKGDSRAPPPSPSRLDTARLVVVVSKVLSVCFPIRSAIPSAVHSSFGCTKFGATVLTSRDGPPTAAITYIGANSFISLFYQYLAPRPTTMFQNRRCIDGGPTDVEILDKLFELGYLDAGMYGESRTLLRTLLQIKVPLLGMVCKERKVIKGKHPPYSSASGSGVLRANLSFYLPNFLAISSSMGILRDLVAEAIWHSVHLHQYSFEMIGPWEWRRPAEQRARVESEKLRQQEREQIAEKRKIGLTLRARVAAKAEEKKLETKTEPPINYLPTKPLYEDAAKDEQQKEQVEKPSVMTLREHQCTLLGNEFPAKSIEEYVGNVEKELERWQNARKARKANSDMNLQETMDKELDSHRLEHGPKKRKIPGRNNNEDEEDVEDINVGEDDMMDDVLDVDDNGGREDETAKAEPGNTSPVPDNAEQP